MDCIGFCFGFFGGSHFNTGKMRNQENRFRCGNGTANNRSGALFLGDGFSCGFSEGAFPDRCQDMVFSGLVGTCHGGFLALLF